MKKIFYSYCEQDRVYQEDLEKHLQTLKENKLITDWHYKKILPSQEWQNEIDEHLKNSDIVLFLMSVNFINSEYCRKELEMAVNSKKRIIPIILKNCAWKDIEIKKKKISDCYQALPDTLKPIDEWDSKDEAWQNIYQKIKKLLESQFDNTNLKITDEFKRFLNETELEKLHGKKESLTLEDIFVSPELEKISVEKIDEKASTLNYENLINHHHYDNIKIGTCTV